MSLLSHILISETSHQLGFRSRSCRGVIVPCQSPRDTVNVRQLWFLASFFLDYNGSMNLDCKPEISAGWPFSSQGSYFLLPLLSAKFEAWKFLFCTFLWESLFPIKFYIKVVAFQCSSFMTGSFSPRLGCFLCSLSGT